MKSLLSAITRLFFAPAVAVPTSAPVALSAVALSQVSGGSPHGTWGVTDAQASPHGTW
jgi:hypothetical protein